MKHISILIALLTLAACTTSPIQQAPIDAAKKSESSSSVEESVKPEKPVAEPKITVTGTKLSK
ncbi:hypothetical protein L1286_21975, partial [Pseudoalteromonas sp. SMS1]|uniref:hypothetical protein n=1 Tax=Pseudoalteromonas sp. SMS1 TaxID=2908894 RepID=UPI001F1BD783